MSPTGAKTPAFDGTKVKVIVLKWLLFSFAIAVLPVLLRLLGLAVFNRFVNYSPLYSEGQWFLIAIAISADAMGDTLLSRREGTSEPSSLLSLLLGGCCMLTILVSGFLYAVPAIAAQPCPPCPNATPSSSSPLAINVQYILFSSIILAFVAFAAGLTAKILSARNLTTATTATT